MTIVEQLFIGRVWQEEGERNEDAFWFLNGTDPTLQIPLFLDLLSRFSGIFLHRHPILPMNRSTE
uniref:Ovule protein n=1 Tax=Heterorhabditis bacteriophora TaxID=37862 RepID=A0A1I7XGT2_HETBA